MIIKEADERQDLTKLKTLLHRRDLGAARREQINVEIAMIQSGIKGEKDAAYEMKFHFGRSPNWMIIHDLRIEFEGLIAQIDHLLINRFLDFWVCESKRFSRGVSINEHGEFTGTYEGGNYGIGSPIEQNIRHVKILQRVLDSGQIPLPSRFGIKIKPKLHSLILVSTDAIIERPATKLPGLDTVIKNDQLFSTIDRKLEGASAAAAAWSLTKVIGTTTLENMARRLAALHQPSTTTHAAMNARLDAVKPSSKAGAEAGSPLDQAEAGHLVGARCSNCAAAISPAVKDYCQSRKQSFGGELYCMPCQRLMSSRRY